jgi:hypothetical protein
MKPDENKDCCKSESLQSERLQSKPAQISNFEDAPLEEKIARLHVSLRDLRSNYHYIMQQKYELMKKIDELQSHQHGSDGSVMVRPNQGNQGYGSTIGGASMAIDILA